jgi:hypothetical protein
MKCDLHEDRACLTHFQNVAHRQRIATLQGTHYLSVSTISKVEITAPQRKCTMSTNTKKTSSTMASLAAETLNNPNASAIAKSLAASALAQSGTDKQTGAVMEEKAGKVLRSGQYREETNSLAASVLSQANKER